MKILLPGAVKQTKQVININQIEKEVILTNIRRELKINWLFIKRDLTMSIVPGFLFTLTALLKNPPISLTNLIWILLRNLVYFWLCITYFCISNQLTSIEEDRLNKPDRPLVQGIVSERGAQVRWYIAMVLFSVIAWWMGVLEWSILWQVSSIIYNYFGGAKYWLGKNVLSGVAIISEMGASWQMVAPISPIVWSWIAVLGTTCMTLISVADFRDIQGDKTIGRSTFPIVFGDVLSRVILSLCFLMFSFFIHFFLMAPMSNSLIVLLWDTVLFLITCILALRLFCLRTAEADRKTYVIFTYWYCLLLTSSIFVLRV